MTSDGQRQSLSTLAKQPRLTAADVLDLRRVAFAGGVVDDAAADALIALARRPISKDGSFGAFFAEILSDYVIETRAPRGGLDTAKADWLTARLSFGGKIETAAEFDALLASLGKAGAAPEALVLLALRQIKDAVLTGEGAAAQGRVHWSRVIDAIDVDRVLSVIAAIGARALTRAEAEMVFDIADAASGGGNDARWAALFARLISSHLQGLPAGAVPKETPALAAASRAWLLERVRHDGRLSEAERALLGMAAPDLLGLEAGVSAVIAYAA